MRVNISLGVISDGDIRRAILNNALLNLFSWLLHESGSNHSEIPIEEGAESLEKQVM